jgi:hypothetical protein
MGEYLGGRLRCLHRSTEKGVNKRANSGYL